MSNSNIESVDDIVNDFISKWCGDYAPHLLDTDDNAGQQLRYDLTRREERIKRELLEGLKAKAISQRQMVEVKQMGGLGAEYIESRIKVIPIDAIEQQLKTLDGQENTNE